eukprot:scaffold2534_cov260-Pinguiococcus_pyrenoidosus.AAC.23
MSQDWTDERSRVGVVEPGQGREVGRLEIQVNLRRRAAHGSVRQVGSDRGSAITVFMANHHHHVPRFGHFPVRFPETLPCRSHASCVRTAHQPGASRHGQDSDRGVRRSTWRAKSEFPPAQPRKSSSRQPPHLDSSLVGTGRPSRKPSTFEDSGGTPRQWAS